MNTQPALKWQPLLQRLAETGRAPLQFVLDGRTLQAFAGDTVLTAILTQHAQLRTSEFSGEPRAGFCLMGACQDCWVQAESGERFRACGTFVQEGMRLLSGAAGAEKSGQHAGERAGA